MASPRRGTGGKIPGRRTTNEFGADNNGHRMWVIFVQILNRILYFFIVRAITILDKSADYVNNKVTPGGLCFPLKIIARTKRTDLRSGRRQ